MKKIKETLQKMDKKQKFILVGAVAFIFILIICLILFLTNKTSLNGYWKLVSYSINDKEEANYSGDKLSTEYLKVDDKYLINYQFQKEVMISKVQNYYLSTKSNLYLSSKKLDPKKDYELIKLTDETVMGYKSKIKGNQLTITQEEVVGYKVVKVYKKVKTTELPKGIEN